MQIHREMLSASIRKYLVELSGNLILLWFSTTGRSPIDEVVIRKNAGVLHPPPSASDHK